MKVKFYYDTKIVAFEIPNDADGVELAYDAQARRIRLIHGSVPHDSLEDWDFDGMFDDSARTLADAFDIEARCGLQRVEVDNDIIWTSRSITDRVETARANKKGVR